mmetsp:Transcript_24669/g.55836  ORF Transcript_24669/g.55836 Transcript_24669/m.55836 type:complete len:513 (+) Transcript_24669:524-2062(+)
MDYLVLVNDLRDLHGPLHLLDVWNFLALHHWHIDVLIFILDKWHFDGLLHSQHLWHLNVFHWRLQVRSAYLYGVRHIHHLDCWHLNNSISVSDLRHLNDLLHLPYLRHFDILHHLDVHDLFIIDNLRHLDCFLYFLDLHLIHLLYRRHLDDMRFLHLFHHRDIHHFAHMHDLRHFCLLFNSDDRAWFRSLNNFLCDKDVLRNMLNCGYVNLQNMLYRSLDGLLNDHNLRYLHDLLCKGDPQISDLNVRHNSLLRNHLWNFDCFLLDLCHWDVHDMFDKALHDFLLAQNLRHLHNLGHSNWHLYDLFDLLLDKSLFPHLLGDFYHLLLDARYYDLHLLLHHALHYPFLQHRHDNLQNFLLDLRHRYVLDTRSATLIDLSDLGHGDAHDPLHWLLDYLIKEHNLWHLNRLLLDDPKRDLHVLLMHALRRPLRMDYLGHPDDVILEHSPFAWHLNNLRFELRNRYMDNLFHRLLHNFFNAENLGHLYELLMHQHRRVLPGRLPRPGQSRWSQGLR